MTRAIKIFLGILLFFCALWLFWRFIYENPDPIQLRFWIWRTIEFSTGAMAILIFVLGILVSSTIFFSALARSSFEKRRLRREVDALQKMIKENITLTHQK